MQKQMYSTCLMEMKNLWYSKYSANPLLLMFSAVDNFSNRREHEKQR